MESSHTSHWKLYAIALGLAAVAYLFWPAQTKALAPWLILLLCPLSMVWMMRGMHQSHDAARPAKDTTTDHTAKKPSDHSM